MHFMFRNSWGILWGAKGYGFLPFDYVLSRWLASDFWMIRSV
jgi:C1A family cysteine protease